MTWYLAFRWVEQGRGDNSTQGIKSVVYDKNPCRLFVAWQIFHAIQSLCSLQGKTQWASGANQSKIRDSKTINEVSIEISNGCRRSLCKYVVTSALKLIAWTGYLYKNFNQGSNLRCLLNRDSNLSIIGSHLLTNTNSLYKIILEEHSVKQLKSCKTAYTWERLGINKKRDRTSSSISIVQHQRKQAMHTTLGTLWEVQNWCNRPN